jgi:hypothetical protein
MDGAGDRLWVLTAYYNPTRSATRLANFRIFRRHLRAPLLAVELARPGRHQLDVSDADRVIALTGDDCIWQKERLINIGVAALPRHVRAVAWIDCDVILERPNWPALAIARLERDGGILQLFDRAIHLSRAATDSFATAASPADRAPLLAEESIGAAAGAGRGAAAFRQCVDPESRRANGNICSMGMAWAALRSVVERCGLYDRAIVGGGDVLTVAAALELHSTALLGRMLNRHQYGHFVAWAEQARAARLFSALGALRQTALHLWHGDLRHRGYGRRHVITRELDFHPTRDLECAAGGAWRWTVPRSALAAAVAAYFFSRREE